MKTILLFLLATCAICAEVPEERFKLADGRDLIGTYDEKAQKLYVKSGNGQMVINVKLDQIVTRRNYTPSPVESKPVEKLPPTPPVAEKIPATPEFEVDQETQLKENKILDEIFDKVLPKDERPTMNQVLMLTSLVEKELNAMSSAMLKARPVNSPPVRHRCFVSLSESYNLDAGFYHRHYWMLDLNNGEGRCFGVLLVKRNSEDGKAIEEQLKKDKYIPMHVFMHLKNGNFIDLFEADKIINPGSWRFP